MGWFTCKFPKNGGAKIGAYIEATSRENACERASNLDRFEQCDTTLETAFVRRCPPPNEPEEMVNGVTGHDNAYARDGTEYHRQHNRFAEKPWEDI